MIRVPLRNILKSLHKSLFFNSIIRFSSVFAIVAILAVPAVLSSGLPHIEVIALFENKAMLRIDQQQLLMSVGEVSPQGIRLIEADAHKALIEIEGRQLTLELGNIVRALPGSETKKQTKEIYIYRAADNLFRTIGSINGFPVNFLVDTGASGVVINAQEAKRLGINYKKKGTPIMVMTASGKEVATAVKIDKVSISGITLRFIDGLVLEGAEPSTPLLGMSYLNRFNIQHSGNIMKLTKKY